MQTHVAQMLYSDYLTVKLLFKKSIKTNEMTIRGYQI